MGMCSCGVCVCGACVYICAWWCTAHVSCIVWCDECVWCLCHRILEYEFFR